MKCRPDAFKSHGSLDKAYHKDYLKCSAPSTFTPDCVQHLLLISVIFLWTKYLINPDFPIFEYFPSSVL